MRLGARQWTAHSIVDTVKFSKRSYFGQVSV